MHATHPRPAIDAFQLASTRLEAKKRIISMKSPAERWCNAPNAPLEPW
jgi:hypothetical protein